MYPCHRRRLIDCTALMLGAPLPASVLAADAQQAVEARPGEIGVLRNGSTRPAHRPAPPGTGVDGRSVTPARDGAYARQTNSLAQALAQPGTATPPPSGGGGE